MYLTAMSNLSSSTSGNIRQLPSKTDIDLLTYAENTMGRPCEKCGSIEGNGKQKETYIYNQKGSAEISEIHKDHIVVINLMSVEEYSTKNKSSSKY